MINLARDLRFGFSFWKRFKREEHFRRVDDIVRSELEKLGIPMKPMTHRDKAGVQMCVSAELHGVEFCRYANHWHVSSKEAFAPEIQELIGTKGYKSKSANIFTYKKLAKFVTLLKNLHPRPVARVSRV